MNCISKSQKCQVKVLGTGDCLKLDVWILLRPFGWTAIAISDRSKQVMEAEARIEWEGRKQKDTQKCGENRRKMGHQLDGNDPDDIEGIFYFYHQLDSDFKNTFNSQTPPWYPPTGQGKS